MMTSIKGHYNGSYIIPDEEIALTAGQTVIITVLNAADSTIFRAKTEQFDLSRYMGRGEKMFHADAQEYVTELRANDRI